MIHISIPSFQTLADKREPYKRYNVYNLHVNGAFHASVRYSLFYQLHERLVATFGHRLSAPEFPPKGWKSCLDGKAANERRDALAAYFQGVIKNPDIARHSVLEKAFLEFQIVSFRPTASSLRLEIHLPDGRPVQLECYSDDSTSAVMKRLGEAIGLHDEHLTNFGLFLGMPREWDNEGGGGASKVVFDQICVRWLKDFESPFISQSLANRDCESGPHHKLLVRKVIWDVSLEEPLLDNAGSLKLLFLQALNDYHRGIMQSCDDDTLMEKLSALQEQGNFKQFVRQCHLQPDYGYEVLAPVVADYPSPETHCALKVGRRQIVLEYELNSGKLHQTVLRSTRIKTYRISYTSSAANTPNKLQRSSGISEEETTFQLDYLSGREEFRTITLITNQAVLLSLFLQSIAAEILRDQQAQSASPTFKFNDSLSTRAIEQLEVSKANSIVSDDLSIRDYSISGAAENGDTGEPLQGLWWRVISYQMPFGVDESFANITDADL